MESTYQLAISLLTVILVLAGSYFAYDQGYMDPLIEKFGVFMMKAKAEAEAKEMQAQGLKRGEDFVDCKSPFVMPCAAWPVARSALRHSRRLQGFRSSCLRPVAAPMCGPCAANVPLLPALRSVAYDLV
ncbi:hypothetical protein FJTKL_11539 [Diaporthe vaccinii]|uniref:Uncharacterized protein n=1 Tax=Diaporthe vaccinii TaxID=105482 RepID=A0ABR4EGW7_9PEZI